MVRLDKVDTWVWNWIQSLLLDERTLDEGLRSMADRREEELEPKRKRISTLDDLITNIDRKMSKLIIAFEDEQDETINETLQDRIKKLSLQKKSLIQERQSVRSEIEQRELTPHEVQSIKSRAEQIHGRLSAELTVQQKRSILEILDVDVKLRQDEIGRWLDITCGFLPDTESIEFSSS
jgi:phenylalanyl-tRNA synthetase alpha subunit